jgi:hypothetical protein
LSDALISHPSIVALFTAPAAEQALPAPTDRHSFIRKPALA